MLIEPTDKELAEIIDQKEWLISKRRQDDPYKRKLMIELHCLKAARLALQALRQRSGEYDSGGVSGARVETSTGPGIVEITYEQETKP